MQLCCLQLPASHGTLLEYESPVTACLPLQDSMAMLRLLHDLSQQQHWPLWLVVGHCDHRVRPDSGEAAAHVQRFCEALGLPYKQAVADRQTGHWPEVCGMKGLFREPDPLQHAPLQRLYVGAVCMAVPSSADQAGWCRCVCMRARRQLQGTGGSSSWPAWLLRRAVTTWPLGTQPQSAQKQCCTTCSGAHAMLIDHPRDCRTLLHEQETLRQVVLCLYGQRTRLTDRAWWGRAGILVG